MRDKSSRSILQMSDHVFAETVCIRKTNYHMKSTENFGIQSNKLGRNMMDDDKGREKKV